MCVEVTDDKIRKQVVAWKLFDVRSKHIEGLCRGGQYRLNQIYTSTSGPGFQAFAAQKDAKATSKLAWKWMKPRIYKVVLYGARQGVIRQMDSYSDGKPGWTAFKMKIIGIAK